ncbi:YycC family protein [Aneurinibacillus terranovensis]|nr:YycC family protein [Aneurinibacillus terranovensis]
MRPLPISAETAVKLAEKLNIPIEELMHMPQHILMKKLMEAGEVEKKEEK